MSDPLVSFVVPCYKLAHLLPECIASILRQSYTNLEILVMDDCSPDDTAAVAATFTDPRVRYVRNAPNLGHLRNYNKGIDLSRGAYVWLISADDYLRSTDILRKYVDVLESHPKVGYAFCAGYGVRDGRETRVLGAYSGHRDRDRVFSGDTLLKTLLRANFVLTPSGLVRRECYERLGAFDLTMPWCGDWYLWCLFAMHYDVAYFAEPMVCYREHHDLSMTTQLTSERLDSCGTEEVAVLWALKTHADRSGLRRVSALCLKSLAATYGRVLASTRYRTSSLHMNFEWCDESVATHSVSPEEGRRLLADTALAIGNELFWAGDMAGARLYYLSAVSRDRTRVEGYVKLLLLSFGRPGIQLRRLILGAS